MPTDAVRPWLPDLRGADMTVTRLSDLLAARPAVHTVARDALRWHVQAGDDPILYRVDHDVLPPRGPWTADRTTYGPGLLPAGAELVRSVGGWSPPTRLGLHQCLTGEIVLLTALPGDPARTLRAQVCRAGDLAVVPPGAWHLTAVVDGPAEVFGVRVDVAPHRPQAPRRRRRCRSRPSPGWAGSC
ncbi:hypothetical protein BJF78_33210 [Pseudonocardia sp. CNS-139]|nr:hypothetical protein BJF78_33210 [Pseudonocardia sp. CNS-139]